MTITPDASAIVSFSGDYDFLSNFHPCEVLGPGDLVYPTVENAYQASKADAPSGLFGEATTELMELFTILTPGKAKHLGNTVRLRNDWTTVRVGIMEDLLTQKFMQPNMARSLLQTGDVVLIEGNNWDDEFWGAIKMPNGTWRGNNVLGELLMKLRRRLTE